MESDSPPVDLEAEKAAQPVPEIPAVDSKPDVSAEKSGCDGRASFPMNLDFILDIPIEVSVELGKPE
jgi:flagellar motor switch/type III secretory pathway protein FliN